MDHLHFNHIAVYPTDSVFVFFFKASTTHRIPEMTPVLHKSQEVQHGNCNNKFPCLCTLFPLHSLGDGSLASSSFVRIHLASSGVLKLIIFPNSLAWNTDFTRSFASMRNLFPWTMNGSLVNSSKVYCHSHVSCPNVPFVTNNTPLEEGEETIHFEKPKSIMCKIFIHF